eukprot:TRINITY_DN8782_c0_g1_i1.p2 TRINITY_DN8782_c0_g1~~TRINITY_DN8782_c0_g1_i1.p2  ORF type:complete len:366 (+),score=83.59 TRINITY_DN8782_c0_g1_i1:2250-3347(+)
MSQEAALAEQVASKLTLSNGSEASITSADDGDDALIRPPSPLDAPAEQPASLDRLPVTIEGYLLKKCRQRGDEKPWKKRFFCLVRGSLIYHHVQDKSDKPRLFLHLGEAQLAEVEAPSGHGISFKTAKSTYAIAVEGTRRRRDEWWSALTAARNQPPIDFAVLQDDDQELQHSLSSFGRVKSALASAFATSRLGRVLIKRYLDDEAKLLISTVVDFATAESGDSVGSKIEGYVFDVAARIAVIMHAQALPPGVDVPTLQDNTLDFCYQLLHHTRDRRLAKERLQFGKGKVSQVATDKLLESIAYVTQIWRIILEPNVSSKVLMRYDFVVKYLFTSSQLLALLDEPKHRERMVVIDRCLRTLLETY